MNRLAAAISLLCICMASAAAEPSIPRENIPDDLRPRMRRRIDMLYSPDPAARIEAISSLDGWQNRAQPAIPFLLAMLDDTAPDPEADDDYYKELTTVGLWAAKALSQIGPATDPLIARLADPNPVVREYAAFALSGKVEAAQPLAKLLADPVPGVRRRAAESLRWSSDETVVPPLVAALKDADRAVQTAAAQALASATSESDRKAAARILAGDDASLAISLYEGGWIQQGDFPHEMEALLKHNDPKFRMLAVKAFGDPVGQDAAVLASMLDDPDPGVRAAAAAKWQRREAKPPVTGKLLGLLGDPDPRVRLAAAGSLERSTDPRAAKVLGEILFGADPAMASEAAAFLARRVPEDPDVSTMHRGGQEEEYVRQERARYSGDDEVRLLIDALKHADARVRLAAAKNSPRDRRIVEPLVAASRDPDAAVRLAAVTAFRFLNDPRILPAALAALNDPDAAVRREVAVQFDYGSVLKPTLAQLAPHLKNSDPEVRENIAGSLPSDEDRAAVADLMVDALSDDDGHVRSRAAYRLEGPKEPRIVDRLKALLGAENKDAQLQAAAVLAKDKDPRAADVLLGLMQGEDENLRNEAAMALAEAQVHDPRAVQPMIRVLLEGNDYPSDVARYLGACKDARAVEPLLFALEDESDGVRVAAAEALANYEDARTVPPLIAALEDESDEVRIAAMRALAAQRDGRIPAALRQLLNDANVRVREAAAAALRDRPDAGTILVAELDSPNAKARMTAIRALAGWGTEAPVEGWGPLPEDEQPAPADVPALVAALGHFDPAVRNVAELALKRMDLAPAAGAPALLRKALKDPNPAARAAALRVCTRINPLQYEPDDLACMLPADDIAPLVRDPHPDVRAGAIVALACASLEGAVDPAIELLKDPHPGVRAEAVAAIGLFLNNVKLARDDDEDGNAEREAKEQLIAKAQRALIPVLQDDSRAVFDAAVKACSQRRWVAGAGLTTDEMKQVPPYVREFLLAPADCGWSEQGVNALIDALRHPSPAVRHAAAARCVREWENVADDWQKDKDYAYRIPAIAPLIAALKDDDLLVRRDAATALGNLHAEQARGALVAACKDPSSRVRAAASEALGKLKPDAAAGEAGVFERLIASLEDAAPAVVAKAAEALGQRKDARAVEPLIAALARSPKAPYAVARALGEIRDARAVEPLISALEQKDRTDRWCCAEALGKLGDPRAVLPLIDALKEPIDLQRLDDYGTRSQLRSSAAQALGMLGDERAVEPLIEALKDTGGNVSRNAEIALGSIGDPRAFEPLRLMLRKGSRTGWALSRIRHPEVTDALIESLGSENYEVRNDAVRILQERKDADVLPKLVAALGTGPEKGITEILRKRGKAAADALAAGATGNDEAVRIKAGALLAEMRDPRAGGSIAGGLKHENTSVRAAAARHLAAHPDPAAFDALADVVRSEKDPLVRTAAVQALGALKDERAREPLLAALGDASNPVRAEAARALGGVPSADAVTALAAALADEAQSVKIAAVEALGASKRPDALQPLVSALALPDTHVRSHAAYALGRLGIPEARDPLIRILEDRTQDLSVTRAAIDALAAAGDVRAIGPMRAVLAHPTSQIGPDVIRAALRFDHPDVVPMLLEGLSHRSSNTRKAAADVLGQRREKQAVEPLIAALRKGDTLVQEAAADALGKIGDERAVAPLVALLEDDGAGWRAVKALELIASPTAVQPVIPLLSKTGDTAERAASLLASLGPDEALAPLLAALESDDAALRGTVAGALGSFGDRQAVPALIKALDDADDGVRAAAARALGTIRDPAAHEPLARLIARRDSAASTAFHAIRRINSADAGFLAIAYPHKEGKEQREAAMELLAGASTPPAIERAKAVVEAEQPIVRVAAAWVLHTAGVQPELQIQRLCAFIRSTDKTAQRFAIDALAELKTAEAVDGLIELLRGDDKHARSTAAAALGMIGDARAVEPLITALEDNDRSVRAQALLTLGRIGDPRAVDGIAKRLDDPGGRADWVETNASRALAMIGDPRAIEPLRKAQQDGRGYKPVWTTLALLRLNFQPEEQLKKLAGLLAQDFQQGEVPQGLAYMRDRRTVALLIDGMPYCRSEDVDVAADALAELTGQRFGCRILKWREWWRQNGEAFLKGENE